VNYTELKANIQQITENTFTEDQLAMFVDQAEQLIYNAVQIPALRKNQTGSLTTANTYLTLPSDFLYIYSLAVVDADGDYHFLLNKDVNFIREAYPRASFTGLPRHYGQFDEDTLIVGPAPDSNYVVELHYGYYPESIVTAGTTWLGEEFDGALLNGALLEAARFMKADADIIGMYDKMYANSMTVLKMLGDGKLRQDTYRSGQVKVPVR
jgi:hypothetical protein